MNTKTYSLLIIVMVLAAFVFNLSSFEKIDKLNAVEKCPKLQNVRCPVLNPFFEDEPSVKDSLGDAITYYCGSRINPTSVEWGCYHTSTNTIYLRDSKETDGKTLAHERCHWLCGREHITYQTYDIRDSFKTVK